MLRPGAPEFSQIRAPIKTDTLPHPRSKTGAVPRLRGSLHATHAKTVPTTLPNTVALTTAIPPQNTPRENAGPTTTVLSGGGGPAPHPPPRGATKNSRICTINHIEFKKNLNHLQPEPPLKRRKRKFAVPTQHKADVMASVISPAWISAHTRPTNHALSTTALSAQMPDADAKGLKRDKSIFETPVPISAQPQFPWPMDSSEPSPFPPPWPGREERAAMCAESASTDPEGPLGPRATKWVNSLVTWYEKLQAHFGFDESNLAANVHKKADKWEARLQFLRPDQPELLKFIMGFIRCGHVIPFAKTPQKYFRKRNPPSLAVDKARAWAAIRGDIAHGAIHPVNIKEDGIPWCVCPVRTADKSDGSARFIHNTRHVNACVDEKHTKCKLETLLRTRNMFMPNGFLVGSDYKSGYHCIYVHPEYRKYLAFALHVSELTPEATAWLKQQFPQAYYHKKRCFIFQYSVLPFGLCTSCKVFNTMISALVSFWRLCGSGKDPTRASSYIDDIIAAHSAFSRAMKLSIYMVYEAASLGLALKIKKCSYFPRYAMVALGTVVDLKHFQFRVSRKRASKIEKAISDLESAVAVNSETIPAKMVASFIGLIWSISPCCQRAASVMTRDITAVLSAEMCSRLKAPHYSLKVILRAFWSGSVRWHPRAHRQLMFWKAVNFTDLRSHISADVLGKSIELTFRYPAYLSERETSILCQDASATAAGGGQLEWRSHRLRHIDQAFLYIFSKEECKSSSTLREIIGILRCLVATEKSSKSRIIFACDNLQSVNAIKFGSRIPSIQDIACDIFTWCLENGKICWPVWLPRTHPVIKEADRRGRLTIPFDQRSPSSVVRCANSMALRLWGQPLSFDQAASHRSAVVVDGRRLPFNAFNYQPGASGVDMFLQWTSWSCNVNYVFPPCPMTGRLLTFLPSTNARTVVAIPLPVPNEWWSYAIAPNAPGLVLQQRDHGFLVSAFDFRSPAAPHHEWSETISQDDQRAQHI